MLHYRRYGFVLPPESTFAQALATLFAELPDAPIRFLFDDAPGGGACPRILERFPALAPFAVSAASRLSNLDARWQGGNPQAPAEAPRETLLEVAAGIPADFPVWIACILIGPLPWTGGAEVSLREAAARRVPLNKPPFSGLTPSMTYLASGVILQRLSSSGLRLWITEQLAGAENVPPAPGVEALLRRFGPPQTDSILSVPDEQEVREAPAGGAGTAPTSIHAGYKNRLAEIVAGLALPYEPPSPSEFGQVPHEPLGKIRSVIVDTFKKDGWSRTTERLPAGSHKICKQTPAGRRLELSFDTGSWSRHVVCMLTLLSERGAARIPIPADRSLRMQYLTPNRQVLSGVLENMRLVVAHLESTWLAEMEAALDSKA